MFTTLYDPIPLGLFLAINFTSSIHLCKWFYNSRLNNPKYINNLAKLKRRSAYILLLMTPSVVIVIGFIIAHWA